MRNPYHPPASHDVRKKFRKTIGIRCQNGIAKKRGFPASFPPIPVMKVVHEEPFPTRQTFDLARQRAQEIFALPKQDKRGHHPEMALDLLGNGAGSFHELGRLKMTPLIMVD